MPDVAFGSLTIIPPLSKFELKMVSAVHLPPEVDLSQITDDEAPEITKYGRYMQMLRNADSIRSVLEQVGITVQIEDKG